MSAASSSDFTEARYFGLLERSLRRFAFCDFADDLRRDGIALWRHDIDFSPHRALALAKIEASLGAKATYFVMLGSSFYNPFEAAVRDLLREIVVLGHNLGLHYDAVGFHGDTLAHVERIAFEADALRRQIGTDVRAFSLHNPSVSPGVKFDAPEYAGLVNASAPDLRAQFTYVSDSNGRWRFRSLHEVVDDAAVMRLYALTHPEWWTPEPLPPDARVERCIKGRAERVASDYRSFLLQHRPEVVDAK
jgi:hypothetical protein